MFHYSLFFIIEYLFHEHGHLYTYDFFAEKVGFKLGWGCFVFYPFFYIIGGWNAVTLQDPKTPNYILILYCVIFVIGWILSRGANNQKYYFKTNPKQAFLGIKPIAIDNRILISGWWGLSRHINYLGEVIMSTALALCSGFTVFAWLYPLYYIGLLVDRERADGERCLKKYGKYWIEYRERVPYRIIPYVY